MKKILAMILTLCIAVSFAVAFGGLANAESTNPKTDIEVTVGMKFEWNKGTDTDAQWITNKGWSQDGLWSYKVHPINRPGYYMDTTITPDGDYAWNRVPGDTGIGYARARSKGSNFHPGELADIVKVFYCPSGGTIKLDTTIRRAFEFLAQEGSSATPTSLAVYVENRKVFPEGADEYISISSIEDQTYSVTFRVAKNERVYIHIGAMGDQASDAVEMSNTITYEEINEDVGDISDVSLDNTRDTVEAPSSTNKPTNTNRPTIVPPKDNGPNVGLIIGVVVAVVVVAGVAAFIFIKKKKAE